MNHQAIHKDDPHHCFENKHLSSRAEAEAQRQDPTGPTVQGERAWASGKTWASPGAVPGRELMLLLQGLSFLPSEGESPFCSHRFRTTRPESQSQQLSPTRRRPWWKGRGLLCLDQVTWGFPSSLQAFAWARGSPIDHKGFALRGGTREADSTDCSAGREKGRVVNQDIKRASESVSVGQLHPLFPGHLPLHQGHLQSLPPVARQHTHPDCGHTQRRWKSQLRWLRGRWALETICSVHSTASPERREARSRQNPVGEQKPGPPAPCAVHLGEFSR